MQIVVTAMIVLIFGLMELFTDDGCPNSFVDIVTLTVLWREIWREIRTKTCLRIHCLLLLSLAHKKSSSAHILVACFIY